MEEYKASPWGIIPTHWKISSIKEETDVVTDYVANGSFASLAENVKYKSEKDYAVLIRLVDYNNQFRGDFVYIDKNAYEFLGKSKLYGDEIIISNVGANVGTVFRCPHLGCKMSLAPNSIMVKFNGNNDFYYYWLKSRFGQHMLKSIVTGSAQPKFNKTNFRDLQIPVPPLDVQESIASILKSLDDKIEVNRRINDNLEQQAQALFKSWFVDFEPFRDQPFVESELGMIPEGWRVGTFLDNIYVMPGGTPSTSVDEYWKDGTIPFFSPKDVNGVYCFVTEKSITEAGLNNCSSRLYPKGTLFITARGTVGKLALAGVPMAMNQSNYALVAKEGVGKFYLYLLAQTLVSKLLKKANGAVFSAITTRDFNEPNLMPTNNVMERFEELVKPFFDKIFQTCEESRRLAELRDTLLPHLMSGEIKVNEIKGIDYGY